MINKDVILAPSILSADFMNLDNEIKECEKVNWIHYDVMDYHFVPNITFGSKVLKDIRKKSNINIDIHFMVEIVGDMEDFFEDFLEAKPDMMTMHVESLRTPENINEFINICKNNGVVASLAISPDTPVEMVKPYLNKIDNVLVMSVQPGFGGQKFMPICVEKIKELNDLRTKNGYLYTIEVDGGINDETAKLVKEAGADMLVAGSYFFGAKNKDEAIEKLVGNNE